MSVWPHIDCDGRKIGYARVSTKDQKLRMQRDGLQAVGCTPIFEDHGVSGAKPSRPGLDELLAEIGPGDTVVVFKLDRLGRSVLHLADLLVRFQKAGIHFCSLSEGINTTTPGGKLTFHLFSAVAEFQRDLIAENTVLGIEAARKRGKQIGRPRILTPDAIVGAHSAMIQDQRSKSELARNLGVSRMTIARAFKRLELAESPIIPT
jgi:DNA invertase Pin-like site-specific DNA recombinase